MDTLSSHDVSNSNWALGRVNGGNLAESPTNRRRQSDGQMRSIIREKNRLRVAQKRASLSEQEKIQRLDWSIDGICVPESSITHRSNE